MNLARLPPELLQLIAKFLGQADLREYTKTCKAINDAIPPHYFTVLPGSSRMPPEGARKITFDGVAARHSLESAKTLERLRKMNPVNVRELELGNVVKGVAQMAILANFLWPLAPGLDKLVLGFIARERAVSREDDVFLAKYGFTCALARPTVLASGEIFSVPKYEERTKVLETMTYYLGIYLLLLATEVRKEVKFSGLGEQYPEALIKRMLVVSPETGLEVPPFEVMLAQLINHCVLRHTGERTLYTVPEGASRVVTPAKTTATFEFDKAKLWFAEGCVTLEEAYRLPEEFIARLKFGQLKVEANALDALDERVLRRAERVWLKMDKGYTGPQRLRRVLEIRGLERFRISVPTFQILEEVLDEIGNAPRSLKRFDVTVMSTKERVFFDVEGRTLVRALFDGPGPNFMFYMNLPNPVSEIKQRHRAAGNGDLLYVVLGGEPVDALDDDKVYDEFPEEAARLAAAWNGRPEENWIPFGVPLRNFD